MPVYTDVCHAGVMTNRQQSAAARSGGAQADLEARAQRTAERIRTTGVPKQELAAKAGIDRGTLGRLLKADPRITDRTWVRVERALAAFEADMGYDGPVLRPGTAVGDAETVSSVMEYDKDGIRARITLSGKAEAVADAIRRVLSESSSESQREDRPE